MTTTQQIDRTEHFATNCKSCGRTLLNPGYGRNSVHCCGSYRRWYSTTDIREEVRIDDGRDERGRFHHRPSRVKHTVSRVVRIPGGD